MKHSPFHYLPMLLLILWSNPEAMGQSPTAFTYQGFLNDGGAPAQGVYDFQFSIWRTAAATEGRITEVLSADEVSVSDGCFTVTLDFREFLFTEPERWLEIAVRPGSSTGPYTVLAPRQSVTPAPIAQTAFQGLTVPNSTITSAKLANNAVTSAKLASGAVTSNAIAGGQVVRSLNTLRDDVQLVAGANITLTTNGNALQIAAEAGAGGSGWLLSGNAGTSAGSNFLGTTDEEPIEFKVNQHRVMRLEFWSNSPNLVAGYRFNGVAAGTEGSTIAGGGAPTEAKPRPFPQPPLFIPHANSILSDYAAIGGGSDNTISTNSNYATIPGGVSNAVSGAYALAAGQRAKARHPGAFVWADSQEADFASTATNQFAVRAGGGVRVETAGAGMTIDGQPVASGQITAGQIADGTIGVAEVNADEFDTTFWRSSGNGGTTAGTHFLGTTDNQALEFKVNGSRALRIIPDVAAPNLLGGASANTIPAGAYGSVVGGGKNNDLSGNYGVVGGGFNNDILTGTRYSTIGGGYGNSVAANAWYATIPGGRENSASGNYALAAGYRAKANHAGTFVWSDAGASDFASTANNQFLIRAAAGVGINTNNPRSALHVNGEITTTTLQITGGADLAEPFPMVQDDIPPGALVVIDEATPGHLKLSHQAYDKRVAGVVSGANGVNPGLTLHQQGALDQGRNVALSGRVYALAVAANGPIEPGDLLTTSEVPGHAMRVADATRAHGAVIGKAMTGLANGRGMILVLVNLQ